MEQKDTKYRSGIEHKWKHSVTQKRTRLWWPEQEDNVQNCITEQKRTMSSDASPSTLIDHPGSPGQNPETCKTLVVVVAAAAVV